MVRKRFMIVAGEPSGDMLAAELVRALRVKLTDLEGAPSKDRQPLQASLEPEFFGAGGSHLSTAGADLAFDLTKEAVVGLWEVIRNYPKFRRLFRQLVQLAVARQPHVIVCVDFSGFNLRFSHAIKKRVRSLAGTFGNWQPRIVQYVSPQVWASRPERARRLAENCDLLLAILPFEKTWYADRTPNLRVEFVGHPIVDRYRPAGFPPGGASCAGSGKSPHYPDSVLLLPGSRAGELKLHLPVMLEALAQIRQATPGLCAGMVLPDETLAESARTFPLPHDLSVQVGNLPQALSHARLAIASTGTVTLECAYFGVPTVALYKTSPITYQVARRLVQVKFLAMPNLLAGEEVFPELIQDAATAENIARAGQDLLADPERRRKLRTKLQALIASLGPPGAADRAAQAILMLLQNEPPPLRAFLA